MLSTPLNSSNHSATASPDTQSAKHFKVLIAEDNAALRDVLASFLARLGIGWRLVEDGQQAVEEYTRALLAGTPYDLLVFDVNMPVMNGIDAARAVRVVEQDYIRQHGKLPGTNVHNSQFLVPLAFFTAYAESLSSEILQEVDACGLWMKPDAIVNLGARILSALKPEAVKAAAVYEV